MDREAQNKLEILVLAENQARSEIVEYQIRKKLSLPINLMVENTEKLQYNVTIRQPIDVDYEQKPKEVMPDCCKIHQDEFKADLKVEDLMFSEQKNSLIVTNSNVFEPIFELYNTGKKNLKYVFDKVKDVNYNVNEKVSKLYEVVKKSFSPKVAYNK